MGEAGVGTQVVVVAGDITLDWNLARLSADNMAFTWNPGDAACVCAQRGGAAMLGEVVGELAARCGFEVRSFAPLPTDLPPGNPHYHESYAMWAPYPNPRGVQPASVWRVSGYLGLDLATVSGDAAARWRVVDDHTSPAVIVLDDAGLGFRDAPELWPQAVQSAAPDPWILVKTASPVAAGGLWRHLTERCARRLIAVTTIGDLRGTEVSISRGLSWERTAQDLYWELVHNPRVNSLSRCAHVVVSFHTEGAVLLSRRPGAGVGATARPSWECRLIFDPSVIEGGWRARYQGGMIGYTTALCAGIIRQLMQPEPDVEAGVQAGLSAMRALHLHGYGEQAPSGPITNPRFPVGTVADVAESAAAELAAIDVENPVRRLTLSAEQAGSGRGFWTILDAVCGSAGETCGQFEDPLAATAERIVLEGPESALGGVPICRFGDLVTADRRETEGYRSIARLMEQYCRSRQRKPLAIGVFGPPGSGKSFGVIQIAQSLSGGDVAVREFNLSQFGGPGDLVDALHQVRDDGLSGAIPLVFWDEFDSDLHAQPLGWLRYFLAPIQDGAFMDGQIRHHIGRAIFVFAGGASQSMAQFDRGRDDAAFVRAKGPDFVSRLRGYVNIMGPDPQRDHPGGDPHYLIRRAILLRSLLQRNAPRIFTDCGAAQPTPDIDPGVLRAFLHVSRYEHGVRSMEAIIRMSTLADCDRFERSCLPSEDQLNLHVNGAESLALVQLPRLEGKLLERLAAATHEVYRGTVGSYAGRPAHADQPYEELSEDLKEQNRDFLRSIFATLTGIGYTLIPARSDDPPLQFPGEHEEMLAEAEHERWMRLKLQQGFRWGADRNEAGLVNPNMLPWDEMSEQERARRYGAAADRIGPGHLTDEQKQWDRDLVRSIPRVLAEAGYTLVQLTEGRQ
ncbi:MAG: RyR domain-containing protein [Armatimonadota bacterium]